MSHNKRDKLRIVDQWKIFLRAFFASTKQIYDFSDAKLSWKLLKEIK